MHAVRLSRWAVVAAACILSACNVHLGNGVTLHEEKRFAVEGAPQVSLITFHGWIEVTSWDGPDVVVDVQKRAMTAEAAAEILVRTTQEGDRVSVEAVFPERLEGAVFGVGPTVALVARVPRQSAIVARTGDGSVTIDGVAGRVDVQSGDGGVTGRRLDGDLTFRTEDGAIQLEDVRGTVDLHTGDGGIRASGAFGRVKAHTGDGAVSVTASAGSACEDDWEITSGDGAVTVSLPSGFSAVVDMQTGDGRVTVEGLALDAQQPSEDRGELRGRLGAGGKLLTIRTGDGAITLGRS
jgi:hypothetical protein